MTTHPSPTTTRLEPDPMTEQTAREPRDFTSSTGRTVSSDAVIGALDTAHLTHYVYRVHGEERAIVAAFPEVLDALTWCDHLSHLDPTPETPWDRYEVPGIDVPPWELEPYVQQVRARKGGASE